MAEVASRVAAGGPGLACFFRSHLHPQLQPQLLIMEKSKSFPYHSSSANSAYTEARFDFEGRTKSYSFNGPAGDCNPEVKRRKRVAGYNMYAMEGKLKSSLRNSFKWIKTKFTHTYYDSSQT